MLHGACVARFDRRLRGGLDTRRLCALAQPQGRAVPHRGPRSAAPVRPRLTCPWRSSRASPAGGCYHFSSTHPFADRRLAARVGACRELFHESFYLRHRAAVARRLRQHHHRTEFRQRSPTRPAAARRRSPMAHHRRRSPPGPHRRGCAACQPAGCRRRRAHRARLQPCTAGRVVRQCDRCRRGHSVGPHAQPGVHLRTIAAQ